MIGVDDRIRVRVRVRVRVLSRGLTLRVMSSVVRGAVPVSVFS